MTDAFDRLEDELCGALGRLHPVTDKRRNPSVARWRPAGAPLTWRTVAVGLVLSLLVLTSAAWGLARLVLSGSPVSYPFGRPVAGAGFGVPLPASVELLALRVADPTGGPPWGLRVFHTSRGFGCLQVGRIVSGRLGVLGEDGAFGDDGRFHELRPGVVLNRDDCVPLDGAGHPHLAVHDGTFPASGMLSSCQPRGTFAARGRAAICPSGGLRSLDYGFAGPNAETIAYRAAKATKTTAASQPDGPYLIVGEPGELVSPHRPVGTPAGRPRPVGPPLVPFTVTQTPDPPVIVRVDYRDGTSCLVQPSTSPVGGCPTHGPVVVAQALPATADVTTPLSVKLTGHGASAVLRMGFRARVGVHSERTGYSFLIEMPDWRRGQPRAGRLRCATAVGLDLNRDVRAGQTVHFDAPIPDNYCTGSYRIQLQYRVQPPHPSPGGAVNLAFPGRVAAVATLTVP